MVIDQDMDRPPASTEHFGEHTANGGTKFTCAACGSLAGEVHPTPAGTPVDMGAPIGTDVHQRDGFAIRWLGYGWKAVSPAIWTRASKVLAAARPDPGALHTIDWELAPFWCRECKQCYCREHWMPIVVMDEGFYDYTDGLCPADHRQILDD